MKIIFIIVVLVFGVVCKAQTTQPLLDVIGNESGIYYKDTHNDFDKFVGTWRYQSGNIIFEIKLQKKVMLHSTESNSYSDMLIGEYRYLDNNGIEVLNTYSNLQLNLGPYKNNIAGKYIRDKNKPVVERRFQLYFKDPQRSYLNREIIVKYIPSQGSTPEKIEIEFKGDTSIVPDENSPTELRVPEQNYTLTKIQ
ncbi:DUF6705 family protein [Flavobacterium sp.]|uniref:DUF6705 family protein n=1 Tax=Flavobacterium sp. TaxID=239 RepID=UPI0040346AFA